MKSQRLCYHPQRASSSELSSSSVQAAALASARHSTSLLQLFLGTHKLKHHTLELSQRRSNSSVDVCAPIPSSSSLSVFHRCVSPFLMWTSFACRCLPSAYHPLLLWQICAPSPRSSACAPFPISFPFRFGPLDSLYESIDSFLQVLGSGLIRFTSRSVPSSHSRTAVPTRPETRY
ncbi:hypothetical protein FB451DRAFT_299986 [Mycena latifolia]|nr:hypothetical protein FB451DRAFT_299986 [Mycena latifolia]